MIKLATLCRSIAAIITGVRVSTSFKDLTLPIAVNICSTEHPRASMKRNLRLRTFQTTSALPASAMSAKAATKKSTNCTLVLPLVYTKVGLAADAQVNE